MPIRRLLIVAYQFPPSAASGAFRLLGFARHLPKFGWGPVVVAPPTLPWEPEDAQLADRVPPETIVRRVPYPKGRVPALLSRVVGTGVWFPGAWAASGRAALEFRPDALLTSGPPHEVHLLGLALARRHRLPWVVDFRDPWVEGGSPGPARSRQARRAARLERAVVRRAGVVVANAPRVGDRLRRTYPASADKIAVVTNGYDPEDFDAPAGPRPSSGPPTIVHAGVLYLGRDPRPFLDALAGLGLEGAPAVRARFLGQNADPAFDLEDEVRRRGLGPAVDVVGQVSYRRVLDELVRADVLLLLDSPGRRDGVPAKVYEYIGAGRPILALAEPDGDLAWVLRESGLPHRIAPISDPAAIRLALLDLIDDPAGRAAGPPPSRRDGPFTREHLAGRLGALLDRIAPPGTVGTRPGPARHQRATHG